MIATILLVWLALCLALAACIAIAGLLGVFALPPAPPHHLHNHDE